MNHHHPENNGQRSNKEAIAIDANAAGGGPAGGVMAKWSKEEVRIIYLSRTRVLVV
jgi:hypothetical protein